MRFGSGAFLRNVAVVASGTAISQAMLVLTSPVLTRMYAPADFGILSVYMFVVPVLSLISGLRYPLAIVLPEDEREAKVVLGTAIRTAATVLLVCLLLAVALRFVGLERVGIKGAPWALLPVAALAAFIAALGEALNYWNVRLKTFSVITTAVVCGTVGTVLLSIGMGLLAAGWWGLVAGMLLGKVVNLLAQLLHGNRLKVVRESLSLSADRPLARAVMRTYADFPKYRLAEELVSSASWTLPALLLVAFFGPATGGLCALAQRVVSAPGALVADAIRKVFYQKAADLGNRRTGLFDATLKTTLGLAAVGILPFGAIVLFGPGFFSLVFGEAWRTAGVYAAWLSVGMFFGFCNVPSVAAVPVVGLQKQFLVYGISAFAGRIIALGAGALLGKPLTAIILYAVSGAMLNLYLMLFVHVQLARGRGRNPEL